MVPWSRGDVIAAIHREGAIVSTRDEVEGMRIRARLSGPSLGRLSEWLIDPVQQRDDSLEDADV